MVQACEQHDLVSKIVLILVSLLAELIIFIDPTSWFHLSVGQTRVPQSRFSSFLIQIIRGQALNYFFYLAFPGVHQVIDMGEALPGIHESKLISLGLDLSIATTLYFYYVFT